MNIPHARPLFGEEEIGAVKRVLESGWVASGPETERFEGEFAQYIGREYAVALSSCTAALHLALLAAGVQPHDGVITTPLSWVATANAILYCGAGPVFVDVDPFTLNIDPEAVHRVCTYHQKGIVPVHLYGQPGDLEALEEIARHYELTIISDCAHAIEAEYRGVKVGKWGDIACFSFWGTKNLSTGEGGMAVTDDRHLAERLRELRSFGLKGGSRQPDGQYRQVSLGYKYVLSDIQAAVGRVQLRRLEQRHGLRVQAASRYNSLLGELRSVTPLGEYSNRRHAHHLYPVLLAPGLDRDRVVRELRGRGIGVGIHYRPIHLEPYYMRRFVYCQGYFPVAEDAGRRVLTLPFWPEITAEEQEIVVQQLQEVLRECPA